MKANLRSVASMVVWFDLEYNANERATTSSVIVEHAVQLRAVVTDA